MRSGVVRSGWARVVGVLAAAACAVVPAAFAQGVTTAAMTGLVQDSATLAPLVGARVVAVHVPSGTSYAGTSREDGRFTLPGMRVGGPYRVSVTYVGYRQLIQEGIYLTLGVAADVHFTLAPVSVQLEPVTISGQADPVFSSQRTGAATAVAVQQVEALPSVTGRVEDLLRLTPQYSPNSFGYSFAGQLNFYNNMTIDGSYFNNSFGLAGQPGDRTGVPAVSLEALEQIEVNVAPYDVRQGNFVGAGVNMVTKSGTNRFRGSLYYNNRNDNLVGTRAGPNTFNPGTFKFSDIGVDLSGPLVRNRLFFYTSFESDAQTQPGTSYLANNGTQASGGNITRVLASDLDSLSGYLLHNFNYVTGPYQNYDFKVPATRFLARLDYAVNDHNKVSLRYNLLNSNAPTLLSNSASLGFGSRRSSINSLNFANSNYAILENIRSIVGEWNSTIGTRMSNNLIVGYTSNDESRKGIAPPWFPEVEILEAGVNYTTFGFEPFTPDNQLRYHSTQLQDNFTVYLRQHSVTVGVSVEKYHSLNVFFPGAQGVWVYNSLADFYTDANDYLANPNRTVSPVAARSFQFRYSNIPGQSEPVQPLDVLYAGAYLQDEWRPVRHLTLTAGLRVDGPKFGRTAYDNAVADTMTFHDANGNAVHWDTGSLPGVNLLWSPRLGFNYDVKGEHRTQIRGGTGIFTGRPAYVWISNQIGNTGVLTGFISATNTTAYPFTPDPSKYGPATVTGAPAASFELNVTDPAFKFPQVWRSNLAVDRRLPWGLTGTAEYLYTKDVNGVAYYNSNLPAPQTAFTGADTRPRWTSSRLYANVADAPVITNEGIGHAWNLAFTVEKPVTGGLYAKVGYSYGVSRNTGDPGSIAFGSWTGIAQSGNPNHPVVGYSAFSPGSRLFAAVTWRRDLLGIGATTVALYFSGNTAGNGSYTFSGDMNGDGASGNDLIYIARNQGEMNFVTNTITNGPTFTPAQQAAAWDAFIAQDKYLSAHRGRYAERNAVFLPMVWRADLSVSQDVGRAIGGTEHRLEVRLDVLNVTNLIDHNWGVSQTFVTNTPLIAAGVDANGASQYRLATVGSGANAQLITTSFRKNALSTDVWRMQLGVHYFFNQ